MFAVFAMITCLVRAVSAMSALFRQSSASGDGDGENDRQECFHGTKVFVADRSRALPPMVVAIAWRTAIQAQQTQSAMISQYFTGWIVPLLLSTPQ
jgi:hypothetical protein